MSEIAARIETIKHRLAELRRGDPEATFLWKMRPPLSEDAIVAIESRLGVPLPAGFRAYVREVGDGGAGMSAYHRQISIVELTDAQIALARRPFRFAKKWKPKSGEDQPADPAEGTINLGIHKGDEYQLLVLHGPLAGQVWIDSTAEDTGGVQPAKPAEYLELRLSFLDKQLARLRKEKKVALAVANGEAQQLLEGKDDKQRDKLVREIKHHAQILLMHQKEDPDPEVCRGVAAAFLLAPTYDSNYVYATLCLLLAGDYPRSHELALEAMAANKRDTSPHTHGVHAVVGGVVAGIATNITFTDDFNYAPTAADTFPKILDRVPRQHLDAIAARLPPWFATLMFARLAEVPWGIMATLVPLLVRYQLVTPKQISKLETFIHDESAVSVAQRHLFLAQLFAPYEPGYAVEQLAWCKSLGHLAIDDPLRKTLEDRGQGKQLAKLEGP